MTATSRRALRAAGLTEADLANPHLVVRMIGPAEPEPKRPPSSREISRRRDKAQAEARAAVEAKALERLVQPELRPLAGRLFSVDMLGLVLCGPRGGIGTSERMAKTLAPLAAGGRHDLAVLMAAGNWADEQALREAFAALSPKLAVLGLRVCRRKAGLRMAKAKTS